MSGIAFRFPIGYVIIILIKQKEHIRKISDNIFRLTIPFMDIYTSVFLIKTPKGAVLFDTATYDSDVTDYIIPFLNDSGVSREELKYVFVSHNHGDHSGGLETLIKTYTRKFY